MHDPGVTIVAVATPPGRGGVGCVRISGPRAEAVGSRLFRPAGRQAGRMGEAPAFGRFLGRDGRPVDHGYRVTFDPGHSFTGEPTVELWPHGSPAVLAELVEAAVGAGAEPAGPGEFTYRALRNGRIDLARAEAVRDLVAARTLYQARVAFAQAEGALSQRLAPLRGALAELIARGEAAVEFVDESETHLTRAQLERGIGDVGRECQRMLGEYRTGRLVREGAALVVTGLPNAGKSSLFNRLLARDRAIVTEVPGTTRDTLEETLDLGGIPVRLVDTAGLREGVDPVETEGVRRAERARGEADLVLLVLDAARPLDPAERAALSRLDDAAEAGRTVVVVNKVDLDGVAERPLPRDGARRVSALTGEGVAGLREALRSRLVGAGPVEDPILTDARHARALEQAAAGLERAAAATGSGLTEELVLEDLRLAMRHLGEITGEFGNEDLYELIFSTFCIGK